ncbi:MAG: HNH endonuclease, partial [Lachnospiraceae bacterium]|nr:HNH endonuclease [Lachnospiraceae bacterium]
MGRIRHKDRILAGSYHSDGYVFSTIDGKQIPIHRFVATEFIPNPENKPEVNHIDGNKMNNSAANLEWVTRSENVRHSVKHNLQPRGLSTYTGKFTLEEREKIKSMWNSGNYSKREIAKVYGVSHTCICDIISNKYACATRVNIFETVARPIVDTLN